MSFKARCYTPYRSDSSRWNKDGVVTLFSNISTIEANRYMEETEFKIETNMSVFQKVIR